MKQNLLILKKTEDGRELVTKITTSKAESILSHEILKTINLAIENNDCFGYGKKIESLGIQRCYTYGNVMDSMESPKDVLTHIIKNNSAIIGGPAENNIWQDPVVLEDGTITDMYLGLISYPCGYAISIGKDTTDIFGNKSNAFVKSIGKRNFHSSSLSRCRIFNSKKAVLDFIEKNMNTLRYMVNNHGYHFDIDFANDFFREDEHERISLLNEKKAEKEMELDDAIASALEVINEEDLENDEASSSDNYPDFSGKTDEEIRDEMKTEAVRRMESLNIMKKIISDFKNGKLLMSEIGGILYDLDADAKLAVQETSDYGIPYHIIKTPTNIGTMYDVLYVSDEPESWNYERRDKQGFMLSNCYNTKLGNDEIGTIKVLSVNGGLCRVL